MLTGRELILYILENGLEDRPVFENGELLGFMSITRAAVMFNVGFSTIRTWFTEGLIPGVIINGVLYIPCNITKPGVETLEEYYKSSSKGVVNSGR